MPTSELQRLRALLGEPIPSGGTEDDTLFSDESLQDFLDENANLERAAYEGWRVKAALLSNLVDTTEGNIQRKFSQLATQAEDMIKLYARTSAGNTEGRTRVGRAVRPGVEW